MKTVLPSPSFTVVSSLILSSEISAKPKVDFYFTQDHDITVRRLSGKSAELFSSVFIIVLVPFLYIWSFLHSGMLRLMRQNNPAVIPQNTPKAHGADGQLPSCCPADDKTKLDPVCMPIVIPRTMILAP